MDISGPFPFTSAMRHTRFFALFLVGFAAIALAQPSPAAVSTVRAGLARIESQSGGRLGVALLDGRGRRLMGYHADQRFAFCSTFKAPLAAAILAAAVQKRLAMDAPVAFSDADILSYAPVVRAHQAEGILSVAELAKAAVEVSDNSAANLLLPLIGGPEGLTVFFRRHGDRISRLDRNEPKLNENRAGDPRDTTSPHAVARLMGRLLFSDLAAAPASMLRGWMESSTTGTRRIRAGLPDGWRAGDKTGTCGTAYNDLAVVQSPEGRDYILAIYLDRPTVSGEQADAAIADVARVAIGMLAEIGPRH